MRLKLLTTIALASAVAGQNQTILQQLLANPQSSTKLVQILNNLGPDSDIIQALNSTTDNYTVFVPNDNAFQHASPTVINQTYGNFENVLLYHVVPQVINTTTNVTDIPLFVGTMQTNKSINRYEDGRGLPVGLANVGQSMSSGNQPMPQNGTQPSSSNTTNGVAHNAQRESILDQDNQEHLTKRQTANNPQVQVGYADGQTANIQTANVPASNGIIHYIDQVLLPPKSPVDTIGSQQYLTTIYDNVLGLNFNDTLDAANGVTIFAPTDEALENANITQYSNTTIAQILRNHVVDGVYFTSNITNSSTLTTFDKGELTFTNASGTVNTNETVTMHSRKEILNHMFDENRSYHYMIDNASIIDADLLTNNGVIHVIDQVLIPEEVAQNNNNTSGGDSSESGGSTSGANIIAPSMIALFIAVFVSAVFF
ncbi:hypothetical protein NQZ79_g7120 [Umbelopsis isabellina]|nr:hypothetical protein NQZ79_g7120 [Umbelopsis isabellina]